MKHVTYDAFQAFIRRFNAQEKRVVHMLGARTYEYVAHGHVIARDVWRLNPEVSRMEIDETFPGFEINPHGPDRPFIRLYRKVYGTMLDGWHFVQEFNTVDTMPWDTKDMRCIRDICQYMRTELGSYGVKCEHYAQIVQGTTVVYQLIEE